MVESQPKTIPAPLNDLQIQVLRNELFGHPADRSRQVIYIKPPKGIPASGTILEFRLRSTNS